MKKTGLIIAALLASNVALAQYGSVDKELASPPPMPEALADPPLKKAAPAAAHPMMPENHPMMKGNMATIPAVNAPPMPVNHPTLQPQNMPPSAQHPMMPANHPTL